VIGDLGAQVEQWCRLAGFPCHLTSSEPALRARVDLEPGAADPLVVDIEGPANDADPLRLRLSFTLPPAATQLEDERVASILEAAVIQRSAMVDARRAARDRVEMVVAVYPDGLNRHTFMVGVFECQKLRDVVRGEVQSAAVGEAAISSLEALVESVEERPT